MDIVKDLEQKLKTLIAALKNELAGIRSNRPTAKLVEDIKVEYSGQILSVKQLGSISIAPPREIVISVWDANAVAPVAKALESSKLGVAVNTSGNLIRINLPQPTQERREELIKLAKSVIEQARIKIRAERDEANKKTEQLFKDKKIGEDQKFRNRDQLQKAVDNANKELDQLLLGKVREIND